MIDKAQNAYRNIRETSEIVGLQAHVLRFWESKFDALEPMKRGGGRRYYSPDDIALIETIKELLYERGLTIKAASRLINQYQTNAIYVAPKAPDAHASPAKEQKSQPIAPKTPLLDAEDLEKLRQIDAQLHVIELHAVAAIQQYSLWMKNIEQSA